MDKEINPIDSLHHVLYEIEEYTYTMPEFDPLMQIIVNMYWEHMALHARNLIYFFANWDKHDDEVKAETYAYENQFKKICIDYTKEYGTEFKNLNKKLAHITKNRIKNFDWQVCIKAIDFKLKPEIKNFLEHIKKWCLSYNSQNNGDKEKIQSYIKRINILIINIKSHIIDIEFNIKGINLQ